MRLNLDFVALYFQNSFKANFLKHSIQANTKFDQTKLRTHLALWDNTLA